MSAVSPKSLQSQKKEKRTKDVNEKLTDAVEQSKSSNKDISAKDICAIHSFSDEEKLKLEECLLTWYDEHQRKLPWRDLAKNESDSDRRGYGVWVSEIMLQQTQVATVIPYYNRWMEKWPNVASLANANREEVNEVWSGLGYYSRARRLHKGACFIVNEMNGHIPQNPETLMTISGIGRYTACAIASVAYGKVVGVVDGNVSRVLSRMRAIGNDITKPSTINHMWNLANDTVSQSRPGDFNQALMEIGAMVCTPRNPKCTKCPLNKLCVSYSYAQKPNKLFTSVDNKKEDKSKEKVDNSSIQDIENVPTCSLCLPSELQTSSPNVSAYPVKRKKRGPRPETIGTVVVEYNNKILMIKRSNIGLLAGLWEFPSVVLPEEACHDLIIEKMLEELGIVCSIAQKRKKIDEVTHIFSHIRATYVVEHLILEEQIEIQNKEKNSRWLMKSEVQTAAISTAMKKVYGALTYYNEKCKRKAARKKRKLESANEDKTQTLIKSFFC